ncbi:MAG TPA: UDP-N-acetylglucosamine 2-epimerase (non-hydrolyzing) [Gaiellaceae bacterium]|nr:UDP-N-acetylglucosamine 2-epimerase (non-hydrolyzing) [Gaiellaceae bacterium]
MGQGVVIVHVVGARPNYMKVAPVYAALARRGNVEQRLVHTGQHYDDELTDVFGRELGLPEPDVRLAVGSGTHAEQTARAMVGLERAFAEARANLVVVAGDVNSTLAGALAAVKLGVPVCHIEAGLRSGDWSMPEEHNRRLTDHVSSVLLTHSKAATTNLRAEGIPAERITFVGNTMIDSLRTCFDSAWMSQPWRTYRVEPESYILTTLHRPALVDSPSLLSAAVERLQDLAQAYPVLFPVHPRTRGRLDALGLSELDGITLLPPLPYGEFIALMAGAAAVLTDSGGVQEESTALRVPCFTLRENTERPVTITAGTNTLLGLDPGAIASIPSYLGKAEARRQLPPLWDGRAGERCADALEAALLRRESKEALVEL